MSDINRLQTWEMVNEDSLDVLETGNRESLNNLLSILNSKINFPFRISLSGTVLTVHGSEIQTYKSDNSEWGNTVESFKNSASPIDGKYNKLVDSTLDFLDGSNSGDFAAGVASSSPMMAADHYVWLGIESRSNGELFLVWGKPDAVLENAEYPSFKGTAVCLVKLQANSSSMPPSLSWGTFKTISPSDIIVFKGSGGTSGGLNDFIPLYKSSTEYRLQNTQGRSTKFNNEYFSISEDLDFNYNLANDKLWYVCIDTSASPGIITNATKLDYIKELDIGPIHPLFPVDYAVLGYYEVVGGRVTQQNIGNFTSRDVDMFIGDFSVNYVSTSAYRIQNSNGRKVRVNDKYFYLEYREDIIRSFTPSVSGEWFVCLNTDLSEGNIKTLDDNTNPYIVETQLDPSVIGFPQHLAPLASITVGNSGIEIANFRTVSDREINTLQGDFVPSYIDNDTYVVNHTYGKKVRLLSDYFYSSTNVVSSFEKSASGTWYIAIDTADLAGPGQLTLSHLKCTVENPSGNTFDPDYVAIGEYFVESDLATVSFIKFIPYSVAGAGSGGSQVPVSNSNEDFAPMYLDSTTFSIKSTAGRNVLFNNKYYNTTEEIIINYNRSVVGTWYISVDTSQPAGEVTPLNSSTYIVMTQIPPYTALANPYYVTVGQYEVNASFLVENTALKNYSIREHTTWMNGIPNIWKKSERKYSTEGFPVLLEHNFGQTPDIVNFMYWDNSSNKFINLNGLDIEISRNNDNVTYMTPADPIITWDLGDYLLVEAIKYAYTLEGGFASPKTDYATDWYSTTPSDIVEHPLSSRPQSISLEFVDLSSTPLYYFEDGLQYVDKNVGGISDTIVTFDWSTFSLMPIVLSPTLKMRIHFNLSKVSAGAFEASKDERGTVSVTGDSSKVISPDIILKASDTNFATTLNSMGSNISVLVSENIYVTSEQELTGAGIYFNMLPGTYIYTGTPGLSSVIKFSGDDFEVENLRIACLANITSGLKINADGVVKNVLVKQEIVGTTMINAVEVTTGNTAAVFGRSKAINGTITNKISDVDGNSEITIA